MRNSFQFLKGKTVQLETPVDMAAKKGACAYVTSVRNMPKYLTVEWIKNGLDNYQHNGDYYPYGFDLVAITPKEKLETLLKNKLISNLEYLEALSEK